MAYEDAHRVEKELRCRAERERELNWVSQLAKGVTRQTELDSPWARTTGAPGVEFSSAGKTERRVTTSSAGLGYERGAMSDKLKYCCAPAREATESMNLSEEDGKKVEAFLIDKTREISVPAMEFGVGGL